MRDPWTIPVLLVLAGLVGHAVGARPAQAQTPALPFSIGETVTISLQGGTHRCRIEEIRGMFARCGDPSGPPVGGYGLGQPDQAQSWVNLAVVEWVTKPRQQK